MPSQDFWADLPDNRKRVAVPPAIVAPAEPFATTPTREASAAPVPPIPQSRRWRWSVVATLRVAALIAFAMIGGGVGIAGWGYETLNAAVDPDATEVQVVQIVPGTSARAIAADLYDRNLLLSEWPFLSYLGLTGRTLRAGTYTLTGNLTTRAIIDRVADGATAEQTITIPEGWRLEEIGSLLEKNTIVSQAEFLAAARYDPVRYTLPSGMTLETNQTLEGLLFPDTYRFAYGVTSKEIVKTMLDNFRTRTADLQPTYDQVILASIVEREAKLDTDRPAIAGVYVNRLNNTMKLDADPTVQYGNDNLAAATSSPATYDWWQPITAAEYQTVQSPYNTYLTGGLPPTPIAVPGLASLEAAVHPSSHTYYYFLHTADGATLYARTAEEHAANKHQGSQ